MKEILEYNGTINMVRCWTHELLRYQYSILHRCDRMTRDIDAISRQFGPSIVMYAHSASLLALEDRAC